MFPRWGNLRQKSCVDTARSHHPAMTPTSPQPPVTLVSPCRPSTPTTCPRSCHRWECVAPQGTMPLGQDGPSWKKRIEDIQRIYDFRDVLGT